MKHKPIPLKTRRLIYAKYNGHCAYCGCLLDYKDMQVDHINSLYRKSLDNHCEDNPNITQDDTLDNLMPSCRQCNYYKSEADIEGFRNKIRNILERTCREPFQAQLALKYGILEYKRWDGMFYFEKINKIIL